MKESGYKIVRFFVKHIFCFLYRPEIVGVENIPKNGSLVIAGNHTKWLDPILLISAVNRPLHFLAKQELFHGITKIVVKIMGCIPVNRGVNGKAALEEAERQLMDGFVIGIFPEGTINRTGNTIMPFKIGAVKMSYDTDSLLVPFIITGEYRIFKGKIRVEFLKPRKIGSNLDKENKRLMNYVSSKLEGINECNKQIETNENKDSMEEII